MINHFIQWYVDLVTLRAGNLSLGFPTVFAVASCGTMSVEQEEVVLRVVGKRRCYFKERLEVRRRFFWEQEFASGELYASTIVCFTEQFMGLITVTLSSGYSKFFLENFKCNLRLIQSNCDIKWMFRARIRDTWVWKLASWRFFTKQKTRGKLALCNIRVVSSAEVVNMDVFQLGNSAVFVRARAPLQSYISSTTA